MLTGSRHRVGDAELSEVVVSIYGFKIGRAVRSENPEVTLVNDWYGLVWPLGSFFLAALERVSDKKVTKL